MEISDCSSKKRHLRQKAQRELKALSEAEKRIQSGAIVDRLARELSNLGSSRTVLIYAALPLEADVWEIIHQRPDLTFALPRVPKEGALLECRLFSDPGGDLSPLAGAGVQDQGRAGRARREH